MTLQELDQHVTALEAEVTEATTIQDGARVLITNLGQFMRNHAGESDVIAALGARLVNANGALDAAGTALNDAVLANTPAAEEPEPTE